MIPFVQVIKKAKEKAEEPAVQVGQVAMTQAADVRRFVNPVSIALAIVVMAVTIPTAVYLASSTGEDWIAPAVVMPIIAAARPIALPRQLL